MSAAMKAKEIREMSDEQIGLTLNETIRELFRLRISVQSDRKNTASESRKHRRLIARLKTIQSERSRAAEAASAETASAG